MAYPTSFIRLSWGGTQADGNEIWSTGMNMADNGGTPQGTLETLEAYAPLLPDVQEAITSMHYDPAMRIPNNAVVRWVKAAPIGTDGKYLGPPVEVETNGVGSINAAYSPQDAAVITLVSNIWKGAGRFNRLFLPTAGPGAVNAWRFSAAEQLAMAERFETFLDELWDIGVNFGPGHSVLPAVISGTREGSSRLVEFIRVGAIVDTQRRRRNQLDEDYVDLPFEPTPIP